MKLIKTAEAIGHILCHDMTQIIAGVTKDARFRKGQVIRAEDIPILLSMGKENLYVWEKLDGMVHEDEAAGFLLRACKGKNLSETSPKEGKVELSSCIEGIFTVDKNRLYQINSVGQTIIATIKNYTPVCAGQKVAGIKIVPLVIEEEKMQDILEIADESNPILSVKPYKVKKASILVTGNEVKKGLITDTFSPIIRSKLHKYGVQVHEVILTGDDTDTICKSIQQAVKSGSQMVICTGGMSVDPDDKTPGAIKLSGADIVSYGMPLMPGVMMMLSYLDGVAVVGLPGCAMYDKITVFDVLLPRLLAQITVTKDDIISLADGGFCQHCETCTWPICAFGS
ncbi:MAG: molybdopterin-binding protein [Treponemataceae bacterium]